MTYTRTRQQRRQERRRLNKKVVSQAKGKTSQIIMDAEGAERLENYTLNSRYPATVLFCVKFDNTSTLQDYIHSCQAGAETFTESPEPQWIVLIKSDSQTALPAPKRDLMKIGTRIVKKRLPEKVCLFLEVTQQEFDEAQGVEKHIAEFIRRFGEMPEDAGFPDWMHAYVYREIDRDL